VPIPRVERGTTIGNFRIEKRLGSGGIQHDSSNYWASFQLGHIYFNE